MDEFSANLNRQLDYIKETTKNAVQKIIRDGFDNAIVDSSAQGWINFARQQGFGDMADELQKDLNSERGQHINEQY